MKFCTKCGAQNEDGLAFCSSCGASLNGGQVEGEKKPFNVLALIGMIAGILACVWCWAYGLFGIIFGIAGLIMSSIAKKNEPGNGMAKAGFICSLIGLIVGVVVLIACVACIGCAACSGGYGYSDLYDLY